MASISSLQVTPASIQCGDVITMEVTVTFAGDPRNVVVAFSIQSPCAFGDGARKVLVSRDGDSPQRFRVMETVTCPSGDTLRPEITATATDEDGSDSSSRRVRVAC